MSARMSAGVLVPGSTTRFVIRGSGSFWNDCRRPFPEVGKPERAARACGRSGTLPGSRRPPAASAGPPPPRRPPGTSRDGSGWSRRPPASRSVAATRSPSLPGVHRATALDVVRFQPVPDRLVEEHAAPAVAHDHRHRAGRGRVASSIRIAPSAASRPTSSGENRSNSSSPVWPPRGPSPDAAARRRARPSPRTITARPGARPRPGRHRTRDDDPLDRVHEARGDLPYRRARCSGGAVGAAPAARRAARSAGASAGPGRVRVRAGRPRPPVARLGPTLPLRATSRAARAAAIRLASSQPSA